MPLTIDDVIDTLMDSADFEEVGSVSKAREFATAAKRFLILTPQSQADNGSSLSMSVQQVENMLKRALDYVAAKESSSGGGSVRHLEIGSFFR